MLIGLTSNPFVSDMQVAFQCAQLSYCIFFVNLPFCSYPQTHISSFSVSKLLSSLYFQVITCSTVKIEVSEEKTTSSQAQNLSTCIHGALILCFQPVLIAKANPSTCALDLISSYLLKDFVYPCTILTLMHHLSNVPFPPAYTPIIIFLILKIFPIWSTHAHFFCSLYYKHSKKLCINIIYLLSSLEYIYWIFTKTVLLKLLFLQIKSSIPSSHF